MNEERLLKRNLIKNILINLFIFVLLFLIFDFIIYKQMSISLFKTVDKELIQEKNNYEGEKYTEYKEKKKEINPRVILIKRDLEENIINGETIGRLYEKFGENIEFSNDNLENVYFLQIEEKYSYRGINFETTDEDGNTIYVQLLANVNGETQTLDNLFRMLIIGTAILITISIPVSYILSKRMMKPIYKAYQK